MLTSGSFLPLYARIGGADDAARLVAMLEAWGAQAPHGVASTDPGAPEFDAGRYWRGPSWLVVNRLIADGLAACGHGGHAAALRQSSRALSERHGLREYFNPKTGEGLGGKDFSWSAAMWLAWAGREDARDVLTQA